MSQLWHYTTARNYVQIANSEELRAFGPRTQREQRKVVWFTTSPHWDHSANPVVTPSDGRRRKATLDETIVVGGGLVRISVGPESAPYDWQMFKRASGVSSKMARAMYEEAIRVGSRPSWWYASFENIPRSRWLAVEQWNDEAWVPSETFQP